MSMSRARAGTYDDPSHYSIGPVLTLTYHNFTARSPLATLTSAGLRPFLIAACTRE
jgi:hypothetical protein